jgi:hypothetical protein
MHIDHLHGLELGQHLARRGATGQRPQLGLQGDLQAVRQEGHEDVGLDAFLGLVEDRPNGQVVLDLLEGLFDLGELDVELPQGIGLVGREVGAQQVSALSSAHLAQLVSIKAELQAGRAGCVLGPRHLDQARLTDHESAHSPPSMKARSGCTM